jgi:hypothetical protein
LSILHGENQRDTAYVALCRRCMPLSLGECGAVCKLGPILREPSLAGRQSGLQEKRTFVPAENSAFFTLALLCRTISCPDGGTRSAGASCHRCMPTYLALHPHWLAVYYAAEHAPRSSNQLSIMDIHLGQLSIHPHVSRGRMAAYSMIYLAYFFLSF